ncbi:hypothetical protein C8R46DRAFT_1184844 [Mycena filopes]|nr:hypothetical protein C8R46DRAFT_1184844 [Mycena filopes]
MSGALLECYIDQLSADIAFCKDAGTTMRDHSNGAVQLFINVCSAWTDIALSNPALWTRVACNFRGYSFFLRLWFERARNYPLWIHLDGALDEDVVELLQEYALQIRHLEISDYEYCQLLTTLAAGSFTSLHTLIIGSLTRSADEYGTPLDTTIPEVMTLLGLFPNLVECTVDTHVNVHDGRDSEEVIEEVITLPRLTRFSFLRGTEEEEDVLSYLTLPVLNELVLRLRGTSDKELLGFLQRCSPPLQTLVLGFPSTYSDGIVTLEKALRLVPSLTHLELRSLHENFTDDFITALGLDQSSGLLPNLRALKIEHARNVPVETHNTYTLMRRAISARRPQLACFHLQFTRTEDFG